MKPLIIEVLGSAVRWCCDSNVFSIDGADSVIEASCYVLPTICCRGTCDYLVHVLCDYRLTCLVNDLADSGTMNPEQLVEDPRYRFQCFPFNSDSLKM